MTYIPLGWTIVYYVIVNAVGTFLMLWDRHLAKHYRNKWVNELLMLFVALLGAAPAMTTVMYVTRHKRRKPKFYVTLPILTVIHMAFIALVALFGPEFYRCVDVGIDYVLLYMMAVSIVAIVLTFLDKNYAKRNLHRIPEDTLMFWAGMGGSVAMLAAMLCFRHKTKHIKFMLGLPIMIIIQSAIFAWLWIYCQFIRFLY